MLKSWYFDSSPNLQACAPDTAGKVVAKPTVGFGPPDTVTVGAEDAGVIVPFVDDDPEARIVNRCETAYVTPCVELRKKTK